MPLSRTYWTVILLLTACVVMKPTSLTAQVGLPKALWQSERFKESLTSVRLGRWPTRDRVMVATLSPKRLSFYQILNEKLVKQFEYKGISEDNWFRLSVLDLNGDGTDEVIVTGSRRDRPYAFIGAFENNVFVVKHEVSHYLTVIPWQRGMRLVSQRAVGGDDFSGPLTVWGMEGNRLIEQLEIKLPGGLSGETPSLLDVLGMVDGGLLYRSESGSLIVYRPRPEGGWKRDWSSGMRLGGAATYFRREIRNPLQQIVEEYFFVPPSLLRSDQVIQRPQLVDLTVQVDNGTVPAPVVLNLVVPPSSGGIYAVRNEGYLKNVTGKVPAVRSAQLVRLEWTGFGYQELWSSPRYDGAIPDFCLVDWDRDGRTEVMAILLLRDRGYWDTLRDQDSLLVVVDTN